MLIKVALRPITKFRAGKRIKGASEQANHQELPGMLHFFFYEFYMFYILCFNLDNNCIVALCISGNMGQRVQMFLVLRLNSIFSLELFPIQMLVHKT